MRGKGNMIVVFILLALCTIFALLFCQRSFAAVSEEEAAQLKTTLTPFGSEKAGNADGTIPAWDGGLKVNWPGFKEGDPRPDPFKGEKPLFSITSKNMDQYADKLTDGVKFTLKKYPDYRLDIYPSHRTVTYPQWLLDATYKCALAGKLRDDNLQMEGSYGGIPFPIPKSGGEIMYNHLCRFQGEAHTMSFRHFYVHPDGKQVMIVEATDDHQFPYHMDYRRGVPYDKWGGDILWLRVYNTGPPYKMGEAIMVRDPIREMYKGRQAWQYLTGQRRVRRAPTIGYDTPDFVASGQNFFDEVFGFGGQLDRYDWKLIGKKELYVPYNTYRIHQVKVHQVMQKGHENPDVMRWELHRIWVVEANLLPGKRHVVPRRLMYIDEDAWGLLLYDGWDAKGQLWRTTVQFPCFSPEVPSVSYAPGVVHNDLTGAYVGFALQNGGPNHMTYRPEGWPESYFLPEDLAATGIR